MFLNLLKNKYIHKYVLLRQMLYCSFRNNEREKDKHIDFCTLKKKMKIIIAGYKICKNYLDRK